MLVRVLCGSCDKTARVEVPPDALPHIDRRALALGALADKGWAYRNGQMGKSVVTALCPKCRPKPLRLDADFVPAEVPPGSD